MSRKSVPAKVAAHLTDTPVGLAVKDGLREVRFNLRRSARKWVPVPEAASGDAPLTLPAPKLLLEDPFGVAVRTTAHLLRSADDAAIELLSGDGEYRAMEVPLQPSATYFAADLPADAPTRPFTRDHYWRLRHLLALTGVTDQFVHEQRIERAGQELRAAIRFDRQRGGADLGGPALRARAALALGDAQALSPSFDATPEEAEASRQVGIRAAIAIVLAGDIAAGCPGSVREQTTTALRMADEICTACAAQWQRALGQPEPEAALAAWMTFVLRHV